MSFTLVCRIAAILIVTHGLMLLTMGLSLAFSAEPGADLSRYIGNRTTGQAIDRGFYFLFIGIAMGTLADISRAVQRK